MKIAMRRDAPTGARVGKRIYPVSWLACVIVFLLDRLPDGIRKQVLESYWTDADIELLRIRAEETWSILNDE